MDRRVLERLSQKSGGRTFFENLEDLGKVFDRIVEDLSNQYLLGYPRPDSARTAGGAGCGWRCRAGS